MLLVYFLSVLFAGVDTKSNNEKLKPKAQVHLVYLYSAVAFKIILSTSYMLVYLDIS